MKRAMTKPWPDVNDYDGESAQLLRTVEHGWDCQFPGWQWVADVTNDEYGNDRTAASCRSKWARLSYRHNDQVELPPNGGSESKNGVVGG